MAPDRLGSGSRFVRTLFNVGTVGGASDAELLHRFVTSHGEPAELAFSVLVDRHGPMVLRTCRQALRDDGAAEDAFQATFLALARRARSFHVCGSLGGWLHQVAWRTASRLRASAARQRRLERNAAEALRESVAVDHGWDDLGEVLNEELGRLPAKYRVPLVLCYLEGLTTEQAARQLGWPPGTVRSRLTRGRERLRGRLLRRGLAPSAAGVIAVLTGRNAWASVPIRLADETARAASLFAAGRVAAGVVPASILSLTEGVLLEMTTTKWKMAGLALVFSGLLSGGAMVLARGPGDAPTESERLRAVEMRLDRVLRALESAGQSGVAPTAPAPRPTATPLEPPAAESNRGTGVIGGDDAGWFHLNVASGTANDAFAALMAWQSQTNARLEKLGAKVESGVVTVNLVATKVTDDDLSTLSVFSNLQQLYLHHTAIGDAGLANLKTSYRLTTLDVFDTRVTDAGLEHLSEWLPHLERLYLSDTQVTDSGLKFLKGLTHLRLLDVRKTKVTAAGVAEIRKALPRAEVLD